MKISRTLFQPNTVFLVVLVFLLVAAQAGAQIGAAVPNWVVPSSGSSTSPGRIHALGDVTLPDAFVGVTPCRIVDTRGPAGPYGAPSLSPGVSRNFALASGPCTGFTAFIGSYSLNITVTNTTGPGFIKIYPQGGSAPVVSTLNYVAGQTVANAAIVPAGAGNGVTVVAGVSGTDLIIDVNGYFPSSFVNNGETFDIAGSFSGGGMVYGQNAANSKFSAGVRGVENADGFPVSGVLGQVGGFGFVGPFTPGSEGVTGINSFSGVLGISMDRSVVGVLLDSAGTDLAEGWAGKSGGSASVLYGVEGILINTIGGAGAAGVFGIDNTGDPGNGGLGQTAGVLGKTSSGYGVVGLSRDAGFAVKGASLDTGGSLAAYGFLGYSNLVALYGVGNFAVTGSKSFIEPHPTDASKVIDYVALEGPEAGIYFRGRSHFENGLATIAVPENFRLVGDEEGMTVQITPIAKMANVAVLSADLNRIVVQASADVDFYYTVNGVRKAYRDFNPIQDNVYFGKEGPNETLPASMAPEQKRRLIANGTFNEDGTLNLATAKRLGWDKLWQAREEAALTAAAENAARSSDRSRKSNDSVSK